MFKTAETQKRCFLSLGARIRAESLIASDKRSPATVTGRGQVAVGRVERLQCSAVQCSATTRVYRDYESDEYLHHAEY